jgi:hypothetical protein
VTSLKWSKFTPGSQEDLSQAEMWSWHSPGKTHQWCPIALWIKARSTVSIGLWPNFNTGLESSLPGHSGLRSFKSQGSNHGLHMPVISMDASQTPVKSFCPLPRHPDYINLLTADPPGNNTFLPQPSAEFKCHMYFCDPLMSTCLQHSCILSPGNQQQLYLFWGFLFGWLGFFF